MKSEEEIREYKNKLAELKAENDRLKELKCKFKEYCTCNTEKYVQCLQEIKEIAEKVMLTELCNSCDGCGLIYGCNDTDCAYYQMEKILQKITKAEEE